MPLRGKKALVTGSSQGIGLAVARAYAAAGADVVLTSERPLEDCPEVRAVLADYPAAVYAQADLTQDGAAEELVNLAWDTLGGLDVLVNNVGTFREPAFLDLTRRHFDFIFQLNVWAAIAVTQAVVRRASAAGRGGRILFSTSLNATRSEPAHTLYDASKGAVNALTRQLAIELAPLGFTTAAVAPGLVETPLTDFGLKSDPLARKAVEDQIPIRRIATPEEIAGWYVFLGSDAARYATGIIIPVDGGLDAQQMAVRPITARERH
ncbi:SDR family NAD(P)-dependent oxidoreductase [Fimbriiglobus ruber]|uniref:3-oxoacyl-[acyl-carrier protein] reductase n=1 Tax=Fimbriiglobus ruber TaxID=1908690 RepID=A0A225DA41_9BACT|nr:SDR family oxidoreductase [Fimbriiglobus ruber]OWK36524.1 3-oxoacyl-[acyl-carrier protein] reductase [Fimbriiglobus ruber]